MIDRLVAPSKIIVNTPVILFRTLTIFQQKVQVLLQFVYRKAMFLTSEQRGSKAAHMRGLRSIQSEKKSYVESFVGLLLCR